MAATVCDNARVPGVVLSRYRLQITAVQWSGHNRPGQGLTCSTDGHIDLIKISIPRTRN